MDAATSDIRAVEFTPSSDGDSPILPELLNQIPESEEIGTVTADGAYDTRRCHADHPDPQEWAAVERGLPGGNRSKRDPARHPALSQGSTGLRGPTGATVPSHSGSGGPDITSEGGSRQKCGA
jgi:hypothetical protein